MADFDGFVLLAEMRTGSNYLEESLNLFPGLRCHGEAFNPGFVGHHNQNLLFGMDRTARDAAPLELLRRIFSRTEGLGGFRLFHDHDPAVLAAVLTDPRIAKIHLTRNPLDSFVSLEIARTTGQWRLTDERHRKSARIHFNAAAFKTYCERLRDYQAHIRHSLQRSGQTAFQIAYEELGDVEVLNGLARFLGLTHRLEVASARLKRQNPAQMSEKVENYEEMQAALAEMGLAGLALSSETEPRHRPAVPNFVAATGAPLLFMPIKGGPVSAVERWLGALSGPEGPERGFTRKTLRPWKNHNKDGRSFTVVCHPVERAHHVFDRHILGRGKHSFPALRHRLRTEFGLSIPEGEADAGFGPAERRAAFLHYLEVVRKTLAGQTALRTDPAFSSQASLVQSFAEVLTPDMVIRAEQLPLGLEQLGRQVGLDAWPEPPETALPGRDILESFYDDTVETAVRAVYNRDFMTFGFRRWKT